MKQLISVIYLVIGLKILYPFFIRYLGFPHLPGMFVSLIVLALFSLIYLMEGVSHRSFNVSEKRLRRYWYLSVFYLLLIFSSAVANHNRLPLVFKSLFDFGILYLMLFFSIIEIDLSEKDQQKLLKFVYILIFIQIPVIILQYLLEGASSADSNSGTVSSFNRGGTGIVAILMSFLLAYAISCILVKGFSTKRVLLALSTFIPPVLGGVRLGLILMPLTVILTIISHTVINSSSISKKYFRSFEIIVLFLIFTIVYLFKIVPESKYANFLNLDLITNSQKYQAYENEDKSDDRIAGYDRLFTEVFNNDANFILGMGTATVTESETANADKQKLQFVSSLPDSVIFLATLGFVGLILILTFFISGIPIIKDYLRVETSEFMLITGYTIFPATFSVIVALFYASTWSTQICLVYWVILAILFQRYSVFKRGLRFLGMTEDSYQKREMLKKTF